MCRRAHSLLYVILFILASGRTSPATPDSSLSSTSAHLTAALTWYCEAIEQEMKQRQRPLSARMDSVESRAGDTPHESTLRAFFQDLEPAAPRELGAAETYRRLCELAQQKGVKGWECPVLKRALELMLSGDDDIDRSLVATLQDDLDLYCSLVAETMRRSPDPVERAMWLGRQCEEQLTNPELRSAFNALAVVPPNRRLEMLRAVAAEGGVADWECAALEKYLAPPEETPQD